MPKKTPLTITVITLFPDFIRGYLGFGIIKKAVVAKLFQLIPVQLRDFGLDSRGTVDDRPYGGGVGMVLRPDVIMKALRSLRLTPAKRKKTRLILLTPQGKPFTQQHAVRLAKYDHLVLISGRYEGFDERVRTMVDEELSIGDYVLMGGELPALVVTEAVIRLRPGIIGKLESTEAESFSESLLEYPQYTKPETLLVGRKKMSVPEVLRSGNHQNVAAWRREQALLRTKKRRPDLLRT